MNYWEVICMIVEILAIVGITGAVATVVELALVGIAASKIVEIVSEAVKKK